VTAIDGWLEGFTHEPASLGMVLLVSLPLGLRHAMDPDHLAAVTTLIASEIEYGVREAGLMSLFSGLGYGSTSCLWGYR
jgi:high-affinity nickel permease